MRWTYQNSYDSFSLEIGEYLVSRDIPLGSITEALLIIKRFRTDEDSEAKVSLILGNGLIKEAGETPEEDILVATFRPNDFGEGALMPGANYIFGLGIKTPTMGKFLEIDPVDNKLNVIRDIIHD